MNPHGCCFAERSIDDGVTWETYEVFTASRMEHMVQLGRTGWISFLVYLGCHLLEMLDISFAFITVLSSRRLDAHFIILAAFCINMMY